MLDSSGQHIEVHSIARHISAATLCWVARDSGVAHAVMPRTICIFLVIFLMEAALPAAFATEASTASERIKSLAERLTTDIIQLGTECGRVGLVVRVHDSEENQLTEEAVSIAARSRLRAARLYAAPGTQAMGILQARVMLSEDEFTYRLWFEKEQLDLMSGIRDWSPTGWDQWRFGGHGGNANFVLSSITRSLDKFIDNYLRVNEFAREEADTTNRKIRLGPELDYDPFAKQ